jgi:outer membrane protein
MTGARIAMFVRCGAVRASTLALALTGAVWAGSARAQSLTDALVMAYENNPNILSQRAHLRSQDEGVNQALSGWRPTVTVNGQAGRSWINAKPSTGGPFLSSSQWPRQGSLTVTQNLYSGGKIEAQTRVADFNVLVERSRLDLVEQATLHAAAVSYVGVVENQAVLELNINNEQVLVRDLEATRDRFAVGEVTRTDVSQAEAALSAAVAAREAAVNQLQISRANYRTTIGETPGQLNDPGEPKGLPEARDESLSLAQNQNPNVLIAVYTERAAIANVDFQFGGLLPQLSVQGLVQRSTNQISRIDDTEAAQILAILSVPIYTGGLVEAQVREAKQVVGQRRLELEQAQRQAIQDATTAWENLQSARAQSRSFEDQIKANEVALEGVQQEAQAGLRTVLDILNAEQALLQSRVSLVTAHHDAITAGYDLLQAVGHLSARDRQLPVDYYDPTAHYDEVREKWFGVGGPVQ